MIRFTSRGGFPVDGSTLSLSGSIFGGSVEPFETSGAVQSSSPADSALRCQRCAGYWWPGCHWRGNSNWLCGLCGEENAIKDRMPLPDEMREFTMLYADSSSSEEVDDNEEEKGNDVVFFFLVDTECEEAFLDASLLAIAAALLVLPDNARFGLAVSTKDAFTVFEFNNDSTVEDFASTTIRIREGVEFRAQLRDAVNSIKDVTCTKGSFAMLKALNSIKTRVSNVQTSSIALTQLPRGKSSNVGRSIEALVAFLATAQEVIGAQTFVFSESASKLSGLDVQALFLSIPLASGIADGIVGGVGVDFFFVSSSVDDDVDPVLRRLVFGSGGSLFDHSYAELEQGEMSRNIKERCSRPFVFRGMVKARSCPELIVLSSSSPSSSSATSSSPVNDGETNQWWIVSALKTVAMTLLATITNRSSPTSSSSSSDIRKQSSNIFLGKGLTSPDDWLWSIPSADPSRSSLGFELDFTQEDGLQFLSYPRLMAVQIASTFVNEHGKRFVRVETRASESDRPVRLPSELWQTMDPKQLVFVLVRILLFSGQYAPRDYANAILAWSRRAMSSGCGADRFEKKLAKPLYGLLRLVKSPLQVKRRRLLGEVNPNDMEKLCWPVLLPVVSVSKTSRMPLGLSKSVLDQSLRDQQDLVLDTTSDIIVLLAGGGGNPDSPDHPAIAAGRALVLKCPHHPRMSVLDLSKVLSSSMDFTSPMKGREAEATGLLWELMYEDAPAMAGLAMGGGDWPLGLQSFVSDIVGTAKRE